MRVVVTGGAGFLGTRLARALLARATLGDGSGRARPIERLTLADVEAPAPGTLPEDGRLEVLRGDFGTAERIERLFADGVDVIFHLAAVVSGGAEEDFRLGMAVNLDGSMRLLEACRGLPAAPRLVFASSVAVYGGEMPEVIEDTTALHPQTSYGTQKAVVELLIDDYSRRGFIDGRALRLPTIVVRPGKPNKAASSFASSIIREPLEGRDYRCPVAPDTGVWVLSPRCAVQAFLHAAELPAERWGTDRALALPGLSVNVRSMVDALAEVAGAEVAARVRWQPDAAIEKIVYGWPTRFDPVRGRALGFRADVDFQGIVRAFIDEELNGAAPGRTVPGARG